MSTEFLIILASVAVTAALVLFDAVRTAPAPTPAMIELLHLIDQRGQLYDMDPLVERCADELHGLQRLKYVGDGGAYGVSYFVTKKGRARLAQDAAAPAALGCEG